MKVQFQRKVSQLQTLLSPKLAEIRANYGGEEAYNKLMAAHKKLDISPFLTLKPMLSSFIQISILIATFNALCKMYQIDGASFLWINNLALPDTIYHFQFNIPIFGNSISFLPILITVITIYSTIVFQNQHALQVEVKRQKRNLYITAIAFVVLFYRFPAAMVLYWTLANTQQTIQQQLIKI